MSKARDIADSNLDGLTVDTSTLVVDSSNNRVGIGTASPAQKLHIYDSTTSKGLKSETDIDGSAANLDAEEFVTFSATTAASGLTFGSGDPRFLTGTVNPSDNTAVWRANNVGLVSTDSIRLYTNGGSERMCILSGGNVGIGTSLPSAKLTVNGSVRALRTDDNTQYGDFGQDSSGGFITTHRPHASLYENFRFLASNNSGTTERMRIDTNGNVGIDTSSPHDSGTSFTVLNVNGVKGGSLAFSRGTNSATKQWAIRTSDDEDLRFEYGSTLASEAMRLDSNGRLLVGKSSSDYTTTGSEINDGGMIIVASSTSTNLGTNSGANILLINPNSTNGNFSNIGSYNTNQLVDSQINFIHESHSSRTGAISFNTHNGSALTERMRIDSSGNVFIGHDGTGTYPFTGHTIRGGDSAIFSRTGTTSETMQVRRDASDGEAIRFYRGSSHAASIKIATNAIGFSTAGASERVRIDANGSLLVSGTTLAEADTFGVSSTGIIYSSRASGSSQTHAIFYNGSGSVGYIATSTTATEYNTSSDKRLKENIADADDAGGKIDAIQVRQFDWKVNGSHQDYGMIAQELQTVAPEAVSGDANSEEMMGVDYSKLVPMLVKEIQSLRKRVAQLEGN